MISQLRSGTPDVTQRNRVLKICSNECRIRARWIIDKNNNVYKTKRKETIHMLFFLKSSKTHKSRRVPLSRKTLVLTYSYCNFHILSIYHVLYFPLWTSAFYFPWFSFYFTDRTWKQGLSILQAIQLCSVKDRSWVS